ncbi:hypothetical protein DV736_g2004, partial [Chaetothyriales sp. CBS 134916]
MTSLFHRRTRSASAQRPQTPASSSAHMAATQAFLASHTSTTNLSASASAAAAALRTMSPRPTAVADLQTKHSTGSMSDRTFRRSPSPGRPAGPADAQPAPPVPKLPPQLPAKAQRRAASVDSPLLLASQPITTNAGRRQRSVRPPAPQLDPQTTAAVLVTNQQRLAAMQRPENRNSSINFSRPLSPLQPSPTSPVSRSPVLANAISAAEAEQVTASVNKAAQQPVKKKKKKLAPQLVEGSHLSTGHMAAKPVTTPLAPRPDLVLQSAANDTTLPSPVTSLASQSTVSTQDSDSDSTPEKIRRQMRASGALTKQPSIVREDWEGEQQQEREMIDTRQKEEPGLSPVSETLSPDFETLSPVPETLSPVSETLSPVSETLNPVQSRKPLTAANVSRKLGEPTLATRAQPSIPSQAATDTQKTGQAAPATQVKLLAAEDNGRVRRLASTSPTRATRFSDRLASDMAAGQKHEPLPRSVSPAKSALKHPASAGAAGAESRVRGSSVTPSEASDSNLSADGQVRRKKSVRVSFEASVETIGVAVGPVDLDSSLVLSPQHAQQGIKGIYGSAKPGLSTIPSQEETDEHIEPRPQLPSFGSVRSKTRRTDASDAVDTPRTGHLLLPPTITSASASTSSELSSSSVSQASIESASSDHAIGSILAQEAQRKGQLAALPERSTTRSAKVSSAQGPDYVSGTETDSSADDRRRLTQGSPPPTPLVHPVQDATTVPKPTAVPALAVQPPTPGSEVQNPTDQWALDLPGGFPVSTDDLSRTSAPNASSSRTTSRASGPAGQPALTSHTLETLGGAGSEEDSDHDSIYSDAEEDLPDGDRDGFASIDALVESPIAGSVVSHLPSPPASPLADRPQGARNTAWDAAQQRWSGIAQQSRQTQTAKIQGSASAPAASTARPSANFRQSMRAPAAAGPNEAPVFRQSMRAQVASARDPSFRQSMRYPPASSVVEPKARPKSMVETPSTPPSQQRAALQKKHIPSAAVSRPVTRKKPVAQLSNDSDSESSFKKSTRKTAVSGAGVYTMRRSMRAGLSDVSSHNDGRGVTRSLSPPRRQPFSPRSEQKPFRSTMRVSADQPVQRKRSSSLFSASRKAIGPVRSQPVPAAAAKPSRVVDSDDEDHPKRKNSDDEPKQKAYATTVAAALSPQISSPPTTKKKGLLFIFRNKKKGEAYETGQVSKHDEDDDGEENQDANGAELSNLGFASIAERDAVVAQTMARLEATKQPNGQRGRATDRALTSTLAPVLEQESGPPPPVHGRLQRRMSSQPAQDSWPLPPKTVAPTGQQGRPSTSDGLLHTNGSVLRPNTHDRVPSSETLPTVVVHGDKKKRFPMLRKAFGLKD